MKEQHTENRQNNRKAETQNGWRGLLHKINEGIHDMCHIWAYEMKNTVKDEGVLIFFILVPLLYPILYAWLYNNETVHEVPVAVVDHSHSQLSRKFIRQFDASPNVKVAAYSNSIEEAKPLIGKQEARGIIYFPSDFASNLNTGKQAHVSIYCDMSIMLYYKAIYQTATEISLGIGEQIQKKGGMGMTERDDEITIQPLAYEDVPIFNPSGGYAAFILPGVLILILHQTLLLGIGMAAGTARENNRYRDLVPVSRHYNGVFRIVLGKSLCYFMVYAVMGAFVTLCIPRMFNLVQLVQMDDYIGLMVPFLLSTIFFGMMISCVVRYRENVMLIIVFTSVPLLFLSGISWPQSNIPGAWRAIAALFPSTFGIRGFVRLNTMGATLADIRFEYQALWIQTTIYFFATCAVYRYQIIQARLHATESARKMKEKIMKAKASSEPA